MNEISDKKIALLIDAENVSEKYIKYILDEVSNYGIPTYKRIYGDWSSDMNKRWRSSLLTYAITPVQQYSYTSGKNSSDSALIIDAMDVLYTGNVQGFCIVSSDSDFTRLATRLREAGMTVIGMGEKKTPKALISACEIFKYLEVLVPKEEKKKKEIKPEVKPEIKQDFKVDKQKDKKKEPQKIEVKPLKPEPAPPEAVQPQIEDQVGEDLTAIVNAIRTIITEISNDDGVASLADIGNALIRRFPEFDARNYGFSKFSEFMLSLNGFEVIKQRTEHPGIVHMFVKVK